MKKGIITEVSASRKDNSMKNIFWGLFSQALHLILSFICRTIFIQKLGVEILGINGLYSNILSVLSIAELGIGNILIFNLYKPLKENDKEKVAKLLSYYKKLYAIIAITITIIGLALLPFLKYIISSDVNIAVQDIYIYYIIFLMSSVFSYLACYKQSLINADQRNYIIKLSNIIFNILQAVLQIIFLLVVPDYRVYLAIAAICVLIQNIILNIFANKLYPEIKQYKNSKLEKEEIKKINGGIFNTFLYKFGSVILTNTDSILISTIISTVWVGLYSNYNMIVTAITGIINIVIMAIYASVGNVILENDKQKTYKVFNTLQFIFALISIFCTLCFISIFNDFIAKWVGSDYLLSSNTVLVISFSFYFSIVNTNLWLFRENLGLFKEVRWLMLAAAVLNIGFSILLGYYWGLDGILIATIIAKFLTIYIFEPIILYKRAFDKKPWAYFLKQILYLVIMVASAFLIIKIDSFVPSSTPGMIAKISINIGYILVLFLLFFKTTEFKETINIVKHFFSNIKNKFKKNGEVNGKQNSN